MHNKIENKVVLKLFKQIHGCGLFETKHLGLGLVMQIMNTLEKITSMSVYLFKKKKYALKGKWTGNLKHSVGLKPEVLPLARPNMTTINKTKKENLATFS